MKMINHTIKVLQIIFVTPMRNSNIMTEDREENLTQDFMILKLQLQLLDQYRGVNLYGNIEYAFSSSIILSEPKNISTSK